ncbi:methyltransferase domain-containing protein [Streptomyces sp. NPDC050121]|uniref:methyltransferase domain-containing protein n=1 Tax=Streptomyces sp. NPDC050121 TaxID=3365601 RepID=UPI0037B0E073
MTSIEIGGGHLVQAGWTNLDAWNGHGEWRRLAQDTPWPTADDSVDAIRAAHVMEHIPAGEPRLAVMNEAHRVLRPGGVFEIRVPNCLSGTWHAFADPTHVSFWCVESFHYFDGLFAANADYGIRPWTTIELRVQGDNEILWKGTPR